LRRGGLTANVVPHWSSPFGAVCGDEAPARPRFASLENGLGILASSAALFAVFLATALLSYRFTIPETQSAVFWIPTGITFALFLRARRTPRLWPGWLAVIFLAEILVVHHFRGLSWVISVGWAAANVLHPVVSVSLAWRYLRGPFALNCMRDVLLMLLLAIAAGVPSSGLAALAARLGLEVPSLSTFALAWGISDFLGLILTAPLILAWTAPETCRPVNRVELGVLFGALVGLSSFVFLRTERGNLDLSLPSLLFFLLAWAAVRFGPRGTTLAILIVDTIMVGAATLHRGPLVTLGLSPALQLANLQILILGSGIVALFLAASVQELLTAKSQAEKAVQARDEFLSIASHELATPLTSLRLSVQGILSKRVHDRATLGRLLFLIQRQADKLTRLNRDLLDSTQIGEGALRLEREELDLRAVADEVIEVNTVLAAEHGSELILRPGAPVTGRWNRSWVERILTHLLSNAVKFGRGRPVEISVTAEGNGMARLEVRDLGDGIPAKRQPFIFQRFEKASERRHYGGFGLGLYITRGLVELLEGSIGVKSAPGMGSTFTVRLPVIPRNGRRSSAPDPRRTAW
jgi:signal transduction histidine kinase